MAAVVKRVAAADVEDEAVKVADNAAVTANVPNRRTNSPLVG